MLTLALILFSSFVKAPPDPPDMSFGTVTPETFAPSVYGLDSNANAVYLFDHGEITYDPIQRVRVSFFGPVDQRNPVFELVEPAGDDSPVINFLKKGGGLHHVCYEIDDLEQGLQEARLAGLMTVALPAPAVAFGGRRIAWICSKRRLLVELLERNKR